MPQQIHLELELPADLARLHLPAGVDARLQDLLDRQDAGDALSPSERSEAEGLVDMSEFMSLLRMRSQHENGG